MGWRWGTPQKGHGTSGSVMGWRLGGGQSKNITSRCNMYVGSNYNYMPTEAPENNRIYVRSYLF